MPHYDLSNRPRLTEALTTAATEYERAAAAYGEALAEALAHPEDPTSPYPASAMAHRCAEHAAHCAHLAIAYRAAIEAAWRTR